MITATATEFAQNVGHYQVRAQREPVKITKNGRAHAVLLSAEDYELLTKGRIAVKSQDLSQGTLDAIQAAKVPDEFAHLDDLMK